MTKKEELLIDACKLLNVRLEPTMVVMACLRTEEQQATMLDWIRKHYKENPTEDEIIEIAEAIMEKVK